MKETLEELKADLAEAEAAVLRVNAEAEIGAEAEAMDKARDKDRAWDRAWVEAESRRVDAEYFARARARNEAEARARIVRINAEIAELENNNE